MKILLLLAGSMLVICGLFGQCPVNAVLSSTGNCPGDTLIVHSPDSLSQIAWYNANSIDTVVKAGQPIVTITTVAGGNGRGTASNQLSQPGGIYVDARGNVYVADYLNSRVQKWAPGSATGITVAGGAGMGFSPNNLFAPPGVYVDKSGNLYISDQSNVKKWVPGAASGTIVAGGNGQGVAPNQLWGAWGVFVDAAGNLYVSDEQYNRVQKFPPGSTSATDGVTVAGYALGVSGNGPGFLFTPLGIFVDSAGNIYVADENNFRVQKIAPGSTNGITVAGGNGRGSEANQLTCPTGVFVDRMGNVFVTDACLGRVQKWMPGATSGITVAGSNGIGPGYDQLQYPEAVFVDSMGNLYVSDAQNDRVLKYEQHVRIDTFYIPRSPGVYRAVVTNNAGCTYTSNSITINPDLPDSVHIVSTAGEACAGSPVSFTATAFNGGTAPAYQWQVNGISTGLNGPVFTDSSLLNGSEVSCVMTSNSGCAVPATSNIISVIIDPLPEVFAGNDTVIAPGKNLELDPVISGTITNYLWTPSTGLDNPHLPAANAEPQVSTTYRLTVDDVHGCSASATIKITVYRTLQMPGAFTPNGDGINDVFRIPPSTPQKIISFVIYNRWGNPVFMTSNSSTGWDGRFKNQLQLPGTYVWEIVYDDLLTGKRSKAKGMVVLAR